MAGDKLDACAHTLHIRILYLAFAVLSLFSLTCFVVTYVSVSQLKGELSQKCTCPDGDMLFEITVLPASPEYRSEGAAAHGSRQVLADLGLAASEPGPLDLRGLNRVRRGVIQGKESGIFKGITIEAYARLPITISLDSITAFCNASLSKCPAASQGPSAGKDGNLSNQDLLGKPGEDSLIHDGQGKPGEEGKNCCSSEDFAMLLAKTSQLAAQIGHPGLKGDVGEPGPKGERGEIGPSGSQGQSGDAGPKGENSEAGPSGPQGLSGEPGSEGPTGEKGDTGDRGPEGQRGEKAQKGELGDAGPIGTQGDQGASGPPGAAGPEGPKGLKGDPGELGPEGVAGLPGDDGRHGRHGEKGDSGVKGEKGDSGFPGSVGLTGATGDMGLPGLQGMTGDAGKDGSNCTCVAEGEAMMELLPTSAEHQRQGGAPGPPGPAGPQGPQGQAGERGLKGDLGSTGLPGSNGTTGFKGQKGDTGEAGLAGPEGVRGRKGAVGLDGLKGHNGDMGDMGSAGSDGLPGPKGDLGPQGLPGPNGTTGFKGQNGDTGEAGLAGPEGVRGRKGAVGPEGLKGDMGEMGPAGQKGDQGMMGLRGVPGLIGLPGVKGNMREVSNVSELLQDIIRSINGSLELIQGPPGPMGSQGPVGPEGKRGREGAMGSKGDPGEMGIEGPQGPLAPPGPKGTPGAKGLAGSFGYPGDPGEKGSVGPLGPLGPIGEPGMFGSPGIDGLPGGQGVKGDQGESGRGGVPGLDGTQGPAGLKGDKGDQGQLGEEGQTGQTGNEGPKGQKGQKGEQGIASGMVQLGNDGEDEKPASEQVKATEEPTPAVKPKAQTPSMASSPNTECLLDKIGSPQDQKFGSTYWGSWMQDTAMDPPYPDKIWVTKHLVGDVLYEYKNLAALKSGTYSKYYRLSDFWQGTGHVVYNNAIYFHNSGTLDIVRYDLTTAAVTVRGSIPDASFLRRNGYGYLYDSDYTYLDLAVDDNGLWVIYKTAAHNHNLVVARLDPENLSVIKTILSNHPDSSSGDGFIICGRLYTAKSSKNYFSTVDFAMNLFTNVELPDVDIPYDNRHLQMTMMSYNPRKRMIYAWDKGNMVTYNVTLVEP